MRRRVQKGSEGSEGSEGVVSPLRSDEFYNQRYILSFPPSSRHPEPWAKDLGTQRHMRQMALNTDRREGAAERRESSSWPLGKR